MSQKKIKLLILVIKKFQLIKKDLVKDVFDKVAEDTIC